MEAECTLLCICVCISMDFNLELMPNTTRQSIIMNSVRFGEVVLCGKLTPSFSYWHDLVLVGD